MEKSPIVCKEPRLICNFASAESGAIEINKRVLKIKDTGN